MQVKRNFYWCTSNDIASVQQSGDGDNSGLHNVAVHCSKDTFVINQNLFFRIKICAKNRHLRQARNH